MANHSVRREKESVSDEERNDLDEQDLDETENAGPADLSRRPLAPEPEPEPEPIPPLDEEEEGAVTIRSRPPIFYFWPTLAASLWFMAFLGLRDKPLPAEPEQAAQAVEADEAANADEKDRESAPGFFRFIPRLGRKASLVMVVAFTLLAVVYLLLHLIFNYSNSRLVEGLDRFMSRDLFLRLNPMDLFFWALVLFVVLSPSYGLLMFLAFHAFGLMTDHKMFTHANRLRRRLIWVTSFIILAVGLSIVRPSPDLGTQYDYAMSSEVSVVFCVLLAFNLFVLAFDFNGASLVALVAVVVMVIGSMFILNIFYPAVGEYLLNMREVTHGLQLNSNFYMFYSYVVSLLLVFSGLIAKADYWRITPLSIVHFQGLLVQRNRHYGALVNFHYHVEFPDFFESLLGGWSGTFILQLPREERPEVINDVWYARYYNKKIRKLLDRADLKIE